MPNVVTKWLTPEEAKGRVLKDGEGVRTRMLLTDRATVDMVSHAIADRAADTAHRAMRDHLSTAWAGADAVPIQHADRDAALAASIAAAEASRKRIADARPDAAAAHSAMVQRLSDSWKGAA